MNSKDEKFYFSIKHNIFIYKWQAVLQEEDNELYKKQLEYKDSGGIFDDIADEYISENDIPKKIPQELTPRQIRLALIQSWINLSNIDTMIDNIPEPQKSVIKTLWEYSLSYSRDDEMLIQFAKQLWMEEDKLDQLFILGAAL